MTKPFRYLQVNFIRLHLIG